MRVFAGNSLARKMTLTVLLASSMALGTLTAALLTFDSISSRALLQSRLFTLADVIGQNSAAALLFNDPPAATEVLAALRAEPPVISACLYDLSGRLFAQYYRQPGVKTCLSQFAGLSPPDRAYPRVIRPVQRDGELAGTLLMTSDLQELKAIWRRLLLVAGCLAVLALTVGGVSGSLLQRRISQPIFDLAQAMQAVTTEQDFSARVTPAGSDEVEQLGMGFNCMLCELERREAEKRKAEAKLQYQALNDELTGLPNRRLFADRLSQVLAMARRERQLVALVYIDLDGFKLVNDSLGHSVGDLLLVQVAARLRTRVRQSDTLARLGGDEFSVVLANISAREDAHRVSQSLLDVLAAPFQIRDHEITIGASVGISIFPDNATDYADLLQQADSAMYAAKRNGKNRAMYFTPELGSLVRERLNLENQLRNAIARGEIHVQYQPEYDVASHRLLRFEALARWTHPTLGVITPAKFIPVAEESGLIVPLGAYIMEMACTEALKWQTITPHPVQVAVNVSSLQFGRDSFIDEVVSTLQHTGLPPELLQIELTESVMLNGVARSAETMKRLKDLGVSLVIDDFGTGYSCLSYLPSLPFDALKVDRSFVRELNSRPEIMAMVRSLVGLAHNIGMRVIVEGVETPEQLESIRKLGGNEVQGYLMGRPTADPVAQLSLLAPFSDEGSTVDSPGPADQITFPSPIRTCSPPRVRSRCSAARQLPILASCAIVRRTRADTRPAPCFARPRSQPAARDASPLCPAVAPNKPASQTPWASDGPRAAAPSLCARRGRCGSRQSQ